jgi:ADP-L-glycero-D-manno-heptose 6-epimerase
MNHGSTSGIYNLGTGKARTFRDLAQATFAALGREESIEFVPTPEDIRDKYQYFTEAEMGKIKGNGYDKAFYSLESGIKDYVQNYLVKHLYF